MAFLRFVISQKDRDSGVEAGPFQLASSLRDSTHVNVTDRDALRDLLEWFNLRLAKPRRFNRSGSKGYYRRATSGISWFRDTANDCVGRMREMKRILEANGYRVDLIKEDLVGYVIYEDDDQVVAEPFSDTRTGA